MLKDSTLQRIHNTLTPRYKSADLITYWNHCWYCGDQLDYHARGNNGKAFSRDHVVPRSKGGTLTVPCCCSCNRMKSALSIDEFRIVFFGVHGGEFYGEGMERKLREQGMEAVSPLANFAIARAMEKWLQRTKRVSVNG